MVSIRECRVIEGDPGVVVIPHLLFSSFPRVRVVFYAASATQDAGRAAARRPARRMHRFSVR
jgi:hypothetical protein